jgi:hypothetical protein
MVSLSSATSSQGTNLPSHDSPFSSCDLPNSPRATHHRAPSRHSVVALVRRPS